MKRGFLIASIMVATWFVAVGCFAGTPGQTNVREVKKGCLAASIVAIKMEIKRFEGWIEMRKNHQVDPQDLPGLEAALADLKADLDKYQRMEANDYPLPKKIATKAWVMDKAANGSILYVPDMSKSGPWYHMAGIVNNDYSVLKPKVARNVVFYELYRRDYWFMPATYIYIGEIQPPGNDGETSTVTDFEQLPETK